jgi:diadenosine tetraphosphate (Ap4A) HIT family hydrolase
LEDIVEIAKRQTEHMFEIGRKETALFEEHSIAYTEELITQNARRKLMIWIYCLLRNYGKLTAIEKLDQDTKEKMWRFVKEVCKGKTEDLQRMKEIAQAFYTIEYFINEK